MPKYLLTFEKGESVRWLGHLDILRTFERAIRRAGLPVAFSTGFNPRERLAFASALSTGMTGECEPATIELSTPCTPQEIVSTLNASLPPGIRIHDCQDIPDAGSRDLLNSFDQAEYRLLCNCPEETTPEEIQQAIDALLAQEEASIVREREGRKKTVNIRPFLNSLTFDSETLSAGRVTLNVIVGIGEGSNAKPAEVVSVLAEHLPGLSVRRACRVRLFREQAAVL
jgi:radical SAM-linked protein